MKRQVVAGLISLALAGCAQSRSSLTNKDKADAPVALKPIPSIHETINRGNGSPAVANATLPNPSNPHWTGMAAPTAGPKPVGGANQLAGASAGAFSAAPSVTPSGSSPPAAGFPLASEAVAQPAPIQLPPVSSLPTSPETAMPQPSSLGNDVHGSAAFTPVGAANPAAGGASNGTTYSLNPVAGLTDANPAMGTMPAASAPSGLPDLPPPNSGALTNAAVGLPAISATGDPAVSPSSAMAPKSNTSAPRGTDPLLGPNPDLMPSMDISTIPPKPPSSKPNGGQAASPNPAPPAALPDGGPSASAASSLTAPAGIPPIGTVPEVSATPPAELSAPVELAPPGDLAPPPELAPAPAGSDKPSGGTASTSPAGHSESSSNTIVAMADSLESAPPSQARTQQTGGPAQLATPVVRNAGGSTLSDGRVVRTSFQQPPTVNAVTDLRSESGHSWKEAGRPAARVGDDIITLEDLMSALRDYFKTRIPPGTKLSMQEKQMLGASVLHQLIDRTLLVQEVKRQIKSPKDMDRLMSIADKYWLDEEVPPLLSKYTAVNERELAEKLKEENRSLAAMKENFKQEFIAQSYIHEKLKDSVKVSLPDLLKYYSEHVERHEFDRPAQITWREIVVEMRKNTNREAARRKADSLLERIKKGEDLAKLARTESDGPTNSRDQGGFMQTSPGGYAIAEVNQALESMPVGQTSGVIEGADGFHIVRVEERRPAGPASFQEVNEKIRGLLVQKRRAEAQAKLIDKIRTKTLITTIFDGTPHDPQRAPTQ